MALNPLVLPVIPSELDSGFCPISYQEMLNGFSAKQTVTFPDTFKGVIVSQSKPTDIDRAWLQLDALGRPVRFYYFSQGAWLSLHPQVPGATMLWTTTLPNFATFDGGDSNPAGLYSGPMWEEVTEMRARFPLGVGTFPVTGTVVAIGGTGGDEKVTLALTNIPSHTHPMTQTDINVGLGTFTCARPPGAQSNPINSATGAAGGDGSTPSATTPHQNLPPFLGVYLLRRTNRTFFAVN